MYTSNYMISLRGYGMVDQNYYNTVVLSVTLPSQVSACPRPEVRRLTSNLDKS